MWDDGMPPFLTDNYYISSYSCPECSKLMYKTVFHQGYRVHKPDGVKS